MWQNPRRQFQCRENRPLFGILFGLRDTAVETLGSPCGERFGPPARCYSLPWFWLHVVEALMRCTLKKNSVFYLDKKPTTFTFPADVLFISLGDPVLRHVVLEYLSKSTQTERFQSDGIICCKTEGFCVLLMDIFSAEESDDLLVVTPSWTIFGIYCCPVVLDPGVAPLSLSTVDRCSRCESWSANLPHRNILASPKLCNGS